MRRAPRDLRMTRPLRRSARALKATATMIAVPEIASCQNGEMLTTGSAFLMTPRNSAPITAPATEPMPPAIEMPPITQAAMTSSSKPPAMST